MNITKEALEYAKYIFRGDSSGHDYDHTLRVFNLTKKIAIEEKADLKTALLIAALHDTDDHKLFSTSKTLSHAKNFLLKTSLSEIEINNILSDISNISYSKGDNNKLSLEGRVVCDADRLDAIGAIGIARCFAYGGSKKRSMKTSLEHFNEKLFKIKELMFTNYGKILASEKHEFLKLFYETYVNEAEGL